MLENLTIRQATLDDAPIIAAFNSQMAWETEQKHLEFNTVLEGVKNLINNPQFGFYLVAELNHQIVGCLLITYEWSDWRNGIFWWIQSVYVLPEMRQKGIFTQLYKTVRELARNNNNVCGLRLYVAESNQRAQATYLKLGMVKTHYQLYEEDFTEISKHEGQNED